MKEQKLLFNKAKGITLIALVITIIVLLILAAVGIATLTGENGLIGKAKKADEETLRAGYKEALEMIRPELVIEEETEGLTPERFMERYEEEIQKLIDKGEIFKGASVTVPNGDILKRRVTTKEGYVFEVEKDNVKYLGQRGEVPPTLTTADIDVIVNPSTPTQGPVTVGITSKIEGFEIEYKVDEEEWARYTEEFTLSNNADILVRLVNDLGDKGGATGTGVRNIDRLEPKNFKPEVTKVTTNSITIRGETEDQEATKTDGSHKIVAYYFSKEEENWEREEPEEGEPVKTEYTFNNLGAGQSYNLRMKAVDEAGNEKVTEETITQSTKGMPKLVEGSNVTFTPSPSTPTSGNVTVKIGTTEEGFTIEWSDTGEEGTWNDYDEKTGVIMEDNGDLYARLKDSIGQVGEAAATRIANIDRTPPTVQIGTDGGTYNIAPGSTTVSVSTKLTASDTGSKLTTLQYAWNTSDRQEPTTGWTDFTSGQTITKALGGGNNYLWLKVIDEAENRSVKKVSNAFTVRYQINFNANGGAGAPGAQYKIHNTALTLSATKPTKDGYDFLGWSTNSGATSATYAAGGSYTSNASATLYAVWSAKTYKITYGTAGDGRVINLNNLPKTYRTGQTISFTINYSGVLAGWNAYDVSTNKQIASGTSSTVKISGITGDIKISIGFYTY